MILTQLSFDSKCVIADVLFIDVWGFDEEAVKALKTMEPDDRETQLIMRYAILLNKDSELLKQFSNFHKVI